MPKDIAEDPPLFDDSFAAELIGKKVLVGVTVEDRRGQFRRHEQFFGVVTAANKNSGVQLELEGTRSGEVKWLPPATNYFVQAEPGVYRLRSTGESVADPDYTCTWKLIQPDA